MYKALQALKIFPHYILTNHLLQELGRLEEKLLYHYIKGIRKRVVGSSKLLFTFDRKIYVTDKDQSSTETHSSKHEKETITNASHVAKKERGLHEARHI